MKLPKIGAIGYNTEYMGIKSSFISPRTFDKAVEKLTKMGIPVDGGTGKNAAFRFPHVDTIPQIKGTKINVFDVKKVLSAFGIKNANLPKTHQYELFVDKYGPKSFDIYDDTAKGDCLVFTANRTFDNAAELLTIPIVKPLWYAMKCIPTPKVAPKRADLAFEVVKRTASAPKEIKVLPNIGK